MAQATGVKVDFALRNKQKLTLKIELSSQFCNFLDVAGQISSANGKSKTTW